MSRAVGPNCMRGAMYTQLVRVECRRGRFVAIDPWCDPRCGIESRTWVSSRVVSVVLASLVMVAIYIRYVTAVRESLSVPFMLLTDNGLRICSSAYRFTHCTITQRG